MTKTNAYLFFIILIASSCMQDRFPIVDQNGEPGVESIIYFWDFNDANTTEISAPLIYSGPATTTYNGVWDYSDGTLLNATEGTVAGACLRLRNPAGSFVIKISTLGFEKLKMSYAVMRTTSGAQENLISYSLDGENYFDVGIDPNKYVVAPEFEIREINFSTVGALNNQAEVYIKIDFNLGQNNASGNNRFDNLTFKATNL